MQSTDLLAEIHSLEQEVIEKKKQLVELRKSIPDRRVENYRFTTSSGKKTTLLELFEDKDELFVVHNMGKGCHYCTMWADGLNGVYHHLRAKAGFVLSSPDAPDIQDSFAASRKWQFPLVSTVETTFTEDMGFGSNGSLLPGVSVFYKDKEDNIFLHAQAPFGPGDDYCITWPLFDLLPSGASDVKAKNKLNNRSTFQLTNNMAVSVQNYPEAVRFYEEVIGMNREITFTNETLFSIGGSNLFIEEGTPGETYFEFAVGDFEKAKEVLLANGSTIEKEFHDKSVLIADPFGLKFHMYEMNS